MEPQKIINIQDNFKEEQSWRYHTSWFQSMLTYINSIERSYGNLNSMMCQSQSCWLFCDPMDCSLPGPSVHGIFRTKILEWVAISSSRTVWYWQKKKKNWIAELTHIWKNYGKGKNIQWKQDFQHHSSINGVEKTGQSMQKTTTTTTTTTN